MRERIDSDSVDWGPLLAKKLSGLEKPAQQSVSVFLITTALFFCGNNCGFAIHHLKAKQYPVPDYQPCQLFLR